MRRIYGIIKIDYSSIDIDRYRKVNMSSKNERLFDRSKYLPRTISVYQIVGAYFIDVYYNHFYTEAVKFRNAGQVPNITEGYRHATFAFITAIDNKSTKTYKVKHYNQLLTGINEYFKLWTSFSTLTLSECIDKIVNEFVPDDYSQTLSKEQKRSILRMILIDVLRKFTKIVTTEYLQLIIDNHEEQANIEALKEVIINLFIEEREFMFHKFLASSSGSADAETVDKKFADRMRQEIERLNTEKQQMSNFIREQTAEIELRKTQLTQVVAKFKKLKDSYDRIVSEYKISAEKISLLEQQIVAEQEKPRDIGLGESSFVTADDEDPTAMDKLISEHTEKEIADSPKPKPVVKPIVKKSAPPKKPTPPPVVKKPVIKKPTKKPNVGPTMPPTVVDKIKPKEEDEDEEEEEDDDDNDDYLKDKALVSKPPVVKPTVKEPPKEQPKEQKKQPEEKESTKEQKDTITSKLTSAAVKAATSPKADMGTAASIADIY
jgi:hypothetical protein